MKSSCKSGSAAVVRDQAIRIAIYFIPPPEHPLCRAAAGWLRRDPFTGASVAGTSDDEEAHAALIADARRYGFHATLKAPFRLAEGRSLAQVADALERFAARLVPFEVALHIARIGAFFAYVPTVESAALHELAARVVAELDHFRAPAGAADLARRNVAALDERQLSHLVSWGYPYVFDQFRFHMTLTGPVEAARADAVGAQLAAHFGAAPVAVPVSQLVISVEPAEQAPFIVHSAHPFAAAGLRRRA